MRRAAALLASLAVTGTLALAVPAPAAAAAQGQLIFTTTGRVVQNPSGCYNPRATPMGIDNRTNQRALIYSERNCEGYVVLAVPPGSSRFTEFGESVYIP